MMTGTSFFSNSRCTEAAKSAKKKTPDHFRYVFGQLFQDTEVLPSTERLGTLKIWEEPIDSAYYVIGADPAYGSSDWADRFCIQVFRCYADGLDQVAEFATHEMNTYQFAWVIAHLAGAYKKISDTINERYKDLVSSDTRKSRIYGAFDTVDNRIHWACTSADAATDNDCLFTLDLRWGVSEASTFTTRVGGASFAPTAVIYYGSDFLRADKRGYLFKHNSSYTTDPKINTLAAYSTWPVQAIVPNYVSTVFNFGYPMVRKWVPKILLSMQNETDVSVQINSINDQSTTTDALLPIRVRENVLWGTVSAIWGTVTPYWSNSQLIEQMRRFPAGSLRCSFKQIQITQAYTIIYNSDTFGVADVSSTTKTATILGALSWPTDAVDYYISFEHDNYVKQYLITSIAGSVVSYLDPSTTQPSDLGSKWLIQGQPKGEVFNILSYIVYYAPLTDQSYRTYRTEQDSTGANA